MTTELKVLQKEKEALSQQVKRLIRAEGMLYDYQQELDAQLKEYQELYEFNRTLNRTHEIDGILKETVAYVIERLNYERAVCLRRDKAGESYRVCALDGYYHPPEQALVAGLVLPRNAPCLATVLAGCEYVICQTDPGHRMHCRGGRPDFIIFDADSQDDDGLAELGGKLQMRDYLIYPLGGPSQPHALLAVGNSAGNSPFHKQIDGSPRSLMSLGNLVGVVSWLIDNRESEQKYRQLSEDLERRVKESVDELRQKDKIMILQGRQAVMGEMISNIAHQWRQPLNILALLLQELEITQKTQGVTEEYVEGCVKKSLEIIRQMSKTIDYFRYFFQPDKEKVDFRVVEVIEKTLSLLNGSFRMHAIETEFLPAGDPAINGYQTEFVQVLLNILINARDALVSGKTDARHIVIRLFSEGERSVVTIADNAGGIPEEIIDRIFDPYFTTKGPEQGTGIGLFMSKTIIEKNMGGRLSVHNTAEGAEFRIEV